MFRDLILRPTMGFTTSVSIFTIAHGPPPARMRWSKPIDHSQRDIGVVVMRLVKILLTIGSLNRECQGGMVRQLIRESSASEKNIFMPVEALVLRIAGGKVIALIVEVHFEFQVFQEVYFQADGREMMHIGGVLAQFNLVAAICESALIVIAQNHPRMMIDVIQEVRTNPPQQGIPMGKRLIVTAYAGPSEQLDFPMFGEAMIQPDGAQMGSDTHVLDASFGSGQFGLPEQLVGSSKVPEPEDRLGCETVDGFKIHRALAELGIPRVDKSANPCRKLRFSKGRRKQLRYTDVRLEDHVFADAGPRDVQDGLRWITIQA